MSFTLHTIIRTFSDVNSYFYCQNGEEDVYSNENDNQ